MRRAVVLVLVLAVGCSTSEQVGSTDVHSSIDAETDCLVLQESFDRAMENVERYEPGDPRRDAPLSYAEHIVSQQEALGC